MATGRTERGDDRRTGRASDRQEGQGVGDRVREQMGDMGDRIREGYGTVRESIDQGYSQAESLVAGHPMESVLIAFGIGVGVGVVLTTLLAQTPRQSWSERYMPDSISEHMPKFMRRR
jgi:ElaB/YqjD/DUF883 family membrane-anchored ribosome-binding protein